MANDLMDWVCTPDRADDLVGPTTFAVGQLANTSRAPSREGALCELLQRLSDPGSDDRFGHRRTVAALSLAELPAEISSGAADVARVAAARWVELYRDLARDHLEAVLPNHQAVFTALGRADRALQHITAETLIDLIIGPTESRREIAVLTEALGRLGARAVTTYSASLLALLAEEENWVVPPAALNAIADVAPALEFEPFEQALLEALSSANPESSQAAAKALASFGQTAAANSVSARLREVAEMDEEEPHRGDRGETLLGVVEGLARLTAINGDPAALRALVRLGQNEDAHVRMSAADWLGLVRHSSTAAEVHTALRRMLADSHLGVRAKALRSLFDLGTEVPLAIILDDALSRLGKQPASWLASFQVVVLPGLAGVTVTESSASELAALLDDADKWRARLSILVLGTITLRTHIDPVVDRLAARISDPDPASASDAMQALAHIGPRAATPGVVSSLLEQVESSSPGAGRLGTLLTTLGTLARFVPGDATAIVRVLEEKLDDPAPSACIPAIRALGQAGRAESRERVSGRLQHLARRNDEAQTAAVAALGALHRDQPDRDVLALLVELMAEPDVSLRLTAAGAFIAAGGGEARVSRKTKGKPRIALLGEPAATD